MKRRTVLFSWVAAGCIAAPGIDRDIDGSAPVLDPSPAASDRHAAIPSDAPFAPRGDVAIPPDAATAPPDAAAVREAAAAAPDGGVPRTPPPYLNPPKFACTTDRLPPLSEDYAQPVDEWWSTHPFNSKNKAGYVPIGSICSAGARLDVKSSFGGDIQAAIDALPAEGGTLFFAPGVYTGPRWTLVGRSNVHFVSDGGAVIMAKGAVAGCAVALRYSEINALLVQGNAKEARVQEAMKCVTSGRVGNIYFKNLVFDGGGVADAIVSAQAVNGVVFDNCIFHNFKPIMDRNLGAALQIHSVVDNVWVRGSIFGGENHFAARFDGAHHSGVVESRFEHSFLDGYLLMAVYADITGDYNRNGLLEENEKRMGNHFVAAYNTFLEQGTVATSPLPTRALSLAAAKSLAIGNRLEGSMDYLAELRGQCQQGAQLCVYGSVKYEFFHNKIVENYAVKPTRALVLASDARYNCNQSCPSTGVRGQMEIGRYAVTGNVVTNAPSRGLVEGTLAGPNLVENNCLAGKLYGTDAPCPR